MYFGFVPFHRTGDRECPMRLSGNTALEMERLSREDPMVQFVSENEKRREEKYARVEQLKKLVEEIRQEERDRRAKKQAKKVYKKEKKEKRERKDKKLKKKSKHTS
jgi:hypothetical protein